MKIFHVFIVKKTGKNSRNCLNSPLIDWSFKCTSLTSMLMTQGGIYSELQETLKVATKKRSWRIHMTFTHQKWFAQPSATWRVALSSEVQHCSSNLIDTSRPQWTLHLRWFQVHRNVYIDIFHLFVDQEMQIVLFSTNQDWELTITSAHLINAPFKTLLETWIRQRSQDDQRLLRIMLRKINS